MTCLSANMYRQISRCTDKTPTKHYWGGGGGGGAVAPPPLATLVTVSTSLSCRRKLRRKLPRSLPGRGRGAWTWTQEGSIITHTPTPSRSPSRSSSDGDDAGPNASQASSVASVAASVASTSSQPTLAKKHRTKKTQFCLDVEEEILMCEFLRENAILWDIKKTDYRRVDKKAKL